MTRARIEALHRQAADLLRDGLCTDHIDREIAGLEADHIITVPNEPIDPPKIGRMTLNLSMTGADSASSSLRSVLDVLSAASSDALEHLVDAFPDLFASEVGGGGVKPIADVGDLFVVKPVDRAALGADEVCFAVNPSDRYLDLVAAIASDNDVSCNLDGHGWPILSTGDRTSVVAEAGAVTSRSGGGLA